MLLGWAAKRLWHWLHDRPVRAPKEPARPVCRACSGQVPDKPERGTLKGYCSIECSMAPEPGEECEAEPPPNVYVPQLNTAALRRGMAMQSGDDE